MGIITTNEPEGLSRRVHREALLHLKSVNDRYVATKANIPCDGDDLFRKHHLDPAQMYRDELLVPSPPPNKLGDLSGIYRYGLECRYLPLHRYLQLSRKVVLTSDWQMAREELLFSRAFERLLEPGIEHFVATKPQATKGRGSASAWDVVLDSARWMYIDFSEEKKWKVEAAKQLADEAVGFLKLRGTVRRKVLHYTPDLLNHLDRETTVYGDNNSSDSRMLGDPEPLIDLYYEWMQTTKPPDHTQSTKSSTLTVGELCEWTEEEDTFLRRSVDTYSQNIDLISQILQKPPESCRQQLQDASPICTSAVRHHILSACMQTSNLCAASAATSTATATTTLRPRPPLTFSQAAKKLHAASTSVHPSHEAAVRKANQNINRLLTPGELALKRLQRNRVIAAGGEASVHLSSAPGTPK